MRIPPLEVFPEAFTANKLAVFLYKTVSVVATNNGEVFDTFLFDNKLFPLSEAETPFNVPEFKFNTDI